MQPILLFFLKLAYPHRHHIHNTKACARNTAFCEWFEFQPAILRYMIIQTTDGGRLRVCAKLVGHSSPALHHNISVRPLVALGHSRSDNV